MTRLIQSSGVTIGMLIVPYHRYLSFRVSTQYILSLIFRISSTVQLESVVSHNSNFLISFTMFSQWLVTAKNCLHCLYKTIKLMFCYTIFSLQIFVYLYMETTNLATCIAHDTVNPNVQGSVVVPLWYTSVSLIKGKTVLL